MQVVVGRVAKVHGIHGELAVDVRTDSPEQRFSLGSVLLARLRNRDTQELTITAMRPHGARLLMRFAQTPDRDAAETLRGALLLADTDSLAPLSDPDEFYDHQLEGLRAELSDGTVIGIVREVLHAPGGELLAIDRARQAGSGAAGNGDSPGGSGAGNNAAKDPNEEAALVPFVREIVPVVDIAGGRVVLDPPEGLLDS